MGDQADAHRLPAGGHLDVGGRRGRGLEQAQPRCQPRVVARVDRHAEEAQDQVAQVRLGLGAIAAIGGPRLAHDHGAAAGAIEVDRAAARLARGVVNQLVEGHRQVGAFVGQLAEVGLAQRLGVGGIARPRLAGGDLERARELIGGQAPHPAARGGIGGADRIAVGRIVAGAAAGGEAQRERERERTDVHGRMPPSIQSMTTSIVALSSGGPLGGISPRKSRSRTRLAFCRQPS